MLRLDRSFIRKKFQLVTSEAFVEPPSCSDKGKDARTHFLSSALLRLCISNNLNCPNSTFPFIYATTPFYTTRH